MTINYSLEVANCKLSTFVRLLCRWRGSVYKLLWKELFLFLGIYFSLSCLYRFFLNPDQRSTFENMVLFCNKYTELIPLTFVLGFYVALVVKRWWEKFQQIPWIDKLAIYFATYIIGNDTEGRLLRRSLVRYLNLSEVLAFRMVSSAVLKRFPTMSHLIDAGFITAEELKVFDSLISPYSKQWIPCQWVATMLYRAKKEGRIESNVVLLKLIEEVNNFRNGVAWMILYDWICVPLVYTQVVALAVYSFFLACLLGRQYLDPEKKLKGTHDVDLIFPFFTALQFLFYVGWLKTAETLLNPMGEDDDDFEVNFIVERNLKMGYTIVDDNYQSVPILKKDLHWDDVNPEIPHTAASFGLKEGCLMGSTGPIEISSEDGEILVPDELLEAEIQSGKSDLTTPTGIRRRKMSTAPQYRKPTASSLGQHLFAHRRFSKAGVNNINDVYGRSISTLSGGGGGKSLRKSLSHPQPSTTATNGHHNEAFRESEEIQADEQP